jgi:hypothetical protein
MIIKAVKAIIKFILHSTRTILWFYRQIKYENFHNYIVKKSQKKSLAIFGNGPSLSDILNCDDIEKIHTDNDILVVNAASISSYYDIIKPQYYLFSDSGYWIGSWIKNREETFDSILTKTSWPLTLFFPFQAFKVYPYKERFKKNTNLSILPYHINTWIGYEHFAHKVYQRGLSMPKAYNVVVGAIFNGINLGYTTINLYGVDHTWTQSMCVNNKNQVCRIKNYFYDQDPSLEPWLKDTGQPYKLYEILRDISDAFESYHKLELYARSKGVTIINHTKNSFIDAFERA